MKQGKFLFVVLFLVGVNEVLGQFSPITNFGTTRSTNVADVGANVGIGTIFSGTNLSYAKLHAVGSSTTPAAIFSSGNVGIGGLATSFTGSSRPTYLLQLRDGNMWVQRGTLRISAVNATDDALLISQGVARLSGGIFAGAQTQGRSGSMEYNFNQGYFELYSWSNMNNYQFKIGSRVNNVDLGSPVLSTTQSMHFQANSGLSTTASNFKFLNGNTELATLTNTGNFGIGTSSPTEKMTVNGNIHLGGNLVGKRTSSTISLASNTDWTNGSLIELSGDDDSFNGRYGNILLLAGKGKTVNGVVKRGEINFASITGDVANGSTFSNNMIIKNNGFVGIGTNSPSYKLEVNGSISNGGADFILGRLDGRSQGTKIAQRALVHDLGDVLWVNYDGDFEGGVKMGGRGLAVKEVCVNQSIAWCDYVFEPDYRLMPLNQLQLFIQKNKHLPEIPTSAEVEKDGISLSKMVTLQMKKIEEMTLYILELETRVKKVEVGR